MVHRRAAELDALKLPAEVHVQAMRVDVLERLDQRHRVGHVAFHEQLETRNGLAFGTLFHRKPDSANEALENEGELTEDEH